MGFVLYIIVNKEKMGSIIKGELKRKNQIATRRLYHRQIHRMFFLAILITIHKKKKMGNYGE